MPVHMRDHMSITCIRRCLSFSARRRRNQDTQPCVSIYILTEALSLRSFSSLRYPHASDTSNSTPKSTHESKTTSFRSCTPAPTRNPITARFDASIPPRCIHRNLVEKRDSARSEDLKRAQPSPGQSIDARLSCILDSWIWRERDSRTRSLKREQVGG